MSILVTGARGLLGSRLVALLAARGERVVATDLRVDGAWPAGVTRFAADLLNANWRQLLEAHGVTQVAHLAAVVASQASTAAGRLHAIEVTGAQRLFTASVRAGVAQFVWASSGAAYGYSRNLPVPVDESWPLSAHPDFPYAAHKQEFEQWLAARPHGGGPRVCVLRPCTVLAPGTSTAVTELFERPRILLLRGYASPFCFIHADDAAAAFAHVLAVNAEGIYNLSGNGTLTLAEIAARLRKPTLSLPAGLLRMGLSMGRALGLTGYTPGQVDFLAYRPVLANQKLKTGLGFTPKFSSEQAFEAWCSGASAVKTSAFSSQA